MPRLRSLLAPLCLVWVIGCSADGVTAPLRVPLALSSATAVAACDNLQASLDAAGPGDLVLIPEGSVCTGHYELPSFQINLEGQGSGAILDGEGEAQILHGQDVGNTVIRNITFRNGHTEGDGAALLINGNSSPTISSSSFVGNSAGGYGGAIALDQPTGTIENSTFFANSSRSGGAVAILIQTEEALDPSLDISIRDNVFGSATQPNTSLAEGGALFVLSAGRVTLTGNRMSNNSAAIGGGAYLAVATGIVTGNTVSSNSATGPGGGIAIEGNGIDPDASLSSAQFTFDGNVIKNNTSVTESGSCDEVCRPGQGGGLYLSRASAAGANNTLSGNSAQDGGGVFINEGTLALTASTISSNTALSSGGGLRTEGAVSLINSTISSNVADVGGGIYVPFHAEEVGGEATLLNSTIADNRAATGTGGGVASEDGVIATNTIFARNLGAGSVPGNCQGVVVSGGHNLEDADTCGFNGTPGDGDIVGRNAMLGPLADNGGPTFTHALAAGSPAVDAADNTACPTVDQRGQSRPKDGNGDRVAVCDIGSYELDAVVPPPATTGLSTKHLRINFGSHGGENAIDWSGAVAFPSGGVINPVTEPVTIRLVSGGVEVFRATLAPGSFVREPDGSYRYRSPKGVRPELDIRFKPRGNGTYDFNINVDEVSPVVTNRSSVEGTIAVGTKTVSQTLPLTDKGKFVEYKQN